MDLELGYSYTSNIVKLLKHLPKLQMLQNGVVSPIMVHCIPTHRCQLNCVHCCFKNREDRTKEMSIETWKKGISQFHSIGVRALEFTGGGDPLLWSHLNEGVSFAKSLGMNIGLITNGIGAKVVKDWSVFDWVRVSLNTLEYRNDLNVNSIKKKTRVSFCYIWHDGSEKFIDRVIQFSNEHKIACRLAPDCIQELDKIDKLMVKARNYLSLFKKNKYVFLSDFNVSTERRRFWDCRIHMIKPCFYLDGWVYSCPSAELAVENNKQVQPAGRLCKVGDIKTFYESRMVLKPRKQTCSYCKYALQQNFLEQLLTPTEFNEYA